MTSCIFFDLAIPSNRGLLGFNENRIIMILLLLVHSGKVSCCLEDQRLQGLCGARRLCFHQGLEGFEGCLVRKKRRACIVHLMRGRITAFLRGLVVHRLEMAGCQSLHSHIIEGLVGIRQ